MENIIYAALFQVYPLICLSVFIVASIYRITFASYTITAKSSQFFDVSRSSWLFKGFHIGIIFILVGHLVGFFSPKWVLEMFNISDELHASIAHISGGAFGVIAFICMIGLLYRRFLVSRIHLNSSFSDNFILILLFTQLLLGLITITSVSSQGLTPGERLGLLEHYLQGFASLDMSAYKNLIGLRIVTLAHIFIGWTLFLVLPFTRLIHVLFIPIHYLVRTGYQIVRKQK